MKKNKETKLKNIRHSLAHLLAKAAIKIDPEVKLGIGPVIENGFYYDFLFSKKISEEKLPIIENYIKEDIKENLSFKGEKISILEAKRIFKNQPFKLELIRDLEKYGSTNFDDIEINIKQGKSKKKKKIDYVTVYRTGDFIDLCRGGHIKNTSEINPNAFKLTKIAGAYWRGSEKNPMLTRIYGVAFETEKELNDYLEKLQLAEKYNHRILGEKLKIFLISEEVGKGFPLLLPKGETIKNILINYLRDKEERKGYLYVSTPHLASSRLYQKSGHLNYYSENMFRVTDPEGEEYFVKPMNCPHHHMIYQYLVRSYRDLPLKLAEPGSVYRFEKSGETYGLMRVRGPITQNDAHIYTDQKNLEKEFEEVIDLFLEVFTEIKIFKNYWFRLSLPDFTGKNREKFGGEIKVWQWASKAINQVVKNKGLDLVQGVGEAAFYGPKLDIQIKNIYGREETLATIQVDILVPQKMNLFYIDSQNKYKNPIVIHRAIIGSYERFIGFVLETTYGDLPLWLSPIQGVILPVKEKNENYAFKNLKVLRENKLRVELWNSEDTLSKRILKAESEKIPLILIVGDREEKNKTLSLRVRKKGDLGERDLAYIVKFIYEETSKFN